MKLAEKITDIINKNPAAVSDIHVKENYPVMIKTPSGFSMVDGEKISKDDITQFMGMPSIGGKSWYARMNEEGGGFSLAHTMHNDTSRIRVSVYEEGGEEKNIALAIRIQPVAPPSSEQLGLPPIIRTLSRKSKRLLIIAGPTGSGKTTTMASIIDQINTQRSLHILAIEQPIEYIHKNKKSLISQREVPSNVNSFGKGLESALRHNPDVIAIGEVMDKETVDTMLRASDSGHFVMATMHTRNCEDTINRLLSFYSGHELPQKLNLISSTLIGIVVQTLVPEKEGTKNCLATEIMVNTKAIAGFIRKNELHNIKNMISQGKSEGMHTLNQCLRQMIADKKIAAESAMRASYDDDELRSTL